MADKIGSDVNRFKDIIKKKVKNNLDKYISSEHMIGQQGGKIIKIPVDRLDAPRFIFGNQGGGASQGEGEDGDPISGSPKDGKGKKGKAGKEGGEHAFEQEFTPDELAQILGEELQLPNIQNKGKGEVEANKNRYNSISNQGPSGLKHFKRTFKESLKRQISSGSYNPADPIIIPRKEDHRYRYTSPQTNPAINTVVIYMMDCSGSMSDEQRFVAKSISFWIDLWLTSQYKNIASRFIVHDAIATEVTKDEFFKVNSSGGTEIASAYQMCADMMEKEYPFSSWNVYPIHFSDGDIGGWGDDAKSIELLKNRILPNSNSFCYGQIANGTHGFNEMLSAAMEGIDNVNISIVSGRNDVIPCIKDFLKKGQ